ncbi:hypothetical protein [Actinacidiphila glaucinigra]|uniref:hypothetical protein n=1 Tax=Actinacidiphila glaucinigra TaxID=235986 RepID=UPI0035DD5125
MEPTPRARRLVTPTAATSQAHPVTARATGHGGRGGWGRSPGGGDRDRNKGSGGNGDGGIIIVVRDNNATIVNNGNGVIAG